MSTHMFACTCMCLYMCTGKPAAIPVCNNKCSVLGMSLGGNHGELEHLAVFLCSSSIFHARGARWGTGG